MVHFSHSLWTILTGLLLDSFHVSEVNIWAWGHNLADIGTFAVPLSTYSLSKTHIKWVPYTVSDKDAVHRLYYIYIYVNL